MCQKAGKNLAVIYLSINNEYINSYKAMQFFQVKLQKQIYIDIPTLYVHQQKYCQEISNKQYYNFQKYFSCYFFLFKNQTRENNSTQIIPRLVQKILQKMKMIFIQFSKIKNLNFRISFNIKFRRAQNFVTKSLYFCLIFFIQKKQTLSSATFRNFVQQHSEILFIFKLIGKFFSINSSRNQIIIIFFTIKYYIFQHILQTINYNNQNNLFYFSKLIFVQIRGFFFVAFAINAKEKI
eukprot:TRINITY_DN6574_c0_g1_i6.p1 TRINITY_DN6574_c0_g1~~TRINITY_DN6574_c0_g1_i6.p1  ORF type:complete len:237 (+),score=-15.94 TRINITY_DN6574_c0_g1_i6:1557-2267(+)